MFLCANSVRHQEKKLYRKQRTVHKTKFPPASCQQIVSIPGDRGEVHLVIMTKVLCFGTKGRFPKSDRFIQ